MAMAAVPKGPTVSRRRSGGGAAGPAGAVVDIARPNKGLSLILGTQLRLGQGPYVMSDGQRPGPGAWEAIAVRVVVTMVGLRGESVNTVDG
jgi:hypothetical protein